MFGERRRRKFATLARFARVLARTERQTKRADGDIAGRLRRGRRGQARREENNSSWQDAMKRAEANDDGRAAPVLASIIEQVDVSTLVGRPET